MTITKKLTEEELLERCRDIYCGEKKFKRNFIRLMKLYGIKHPFRHFMLPKHQRMDASSMQYKDISETFYGFEMSNIICGGVAKTCHKSTLNDCDEETASRLFYILWRRYSL